MVHFFLVDDNTGYRYRIAIEGDLQIATDYLHTKSTEVLYQGEKEEEDCKKLKGNRTLPNGLIIRDFKFRYDKIRSKRPDGTIKGGVTNGQALQVDTRHKQRS
jgi:hypothetical protein